MESERIRRVHEARLTAKRQLGTDPRIPLPGRACGGLLRMWGGVATGRPACQRATGALRCAPVLRMTRRPSLRSESSYGPCGPAWTGASRPSTTSRRTREEQSARGPDVRGSRGEAEPANAGVFLAGAASNWGHPYPHLFQETPTKGVGGTDAAGRTISSNSISACIRVSHLGRCVAILPGDIDRVGVEDLLAKQVDLRAPVLVYPHHGGRPSSAAVRASLERLLRAVSPAVVVFSIGRGRHGTPAPETVMALRDIMPDTRIVCTQLSEHCSAAVPAENVASAVAAR